MVKQESHFVEVEVNLSAPGIIILSEIDYPGWEVSANGKTIENLRAFGLLRAVALPSGNSTVLWKYNPRPVQIGLITSGITVCLLVLLLYKTPYIIKQY